MACFCHGILIHRKGNGRIRIIVQKSHIRQNFGGSVMYISDKIFNRLNELKMTQKDFSEKTGIAQSTISDWRKKKTNPSANKIMAICKVLNVTPESLLSGTESLEDQNNPQSWYAIEAGTDVGQLVTMYNSMDLRMQERLFGYANALMEMQKEHKEQIANT